MRIKYFIRTAKKNNGNQARIRIKLKEGDSLNLYATTPLTIAVKYWNNKAKANRDKVRDMTEFLDRDWYKNKLDDLEKFIRTEYNDLQSHPTSEWLSSIVDNYFRPEKLGVKSITLFEFITDYIESSKTRINPDTGKFIAANTIKKYTTCFNLLKSYKEFAGLEMLDFKDIDLSFYKDFVSYLAANKNHAKNTIGKQIAILKNFMNEAKERDLHSNTKYTSRRFKIVSEDTESVYLSESELDTLYKLDLSNNKKLERVRDLFLIGAWTGCRFGDFTTITPDKIRDNSIVMEQEKTGHKVKIPLHPVVVEILNKYEGKLPKAISNQKFNDYIKDVAKLADGFDKTEQLSKTKGGYRVSTVSPKHDLISSHTARRSFATNLYKRGFPTIGIMKLTGHRTERAFLKYIKVSEDEHAQMLAEHWAKWERSES